MAARQQLRWNTRAAMRGPAMSNSRDKQLEVIVIPVSDVDRAKRFCASLGWRLYADFPGADDFRVVQFTPPGSRCSVHFGKGLTKVAPGSARGMYLVESCVVATRAALAARGVDVSEVVHREAVGLVFLLGLF